LVWSIPLLVLLPAPPPAAAAAALAVVVVAVVVVDVMVVQDVLVFIFWVSTTGDPDEDEGCQGWTKWASSLSS
jgi:hypothetical protein